MTAALFKLTFVLLVLLWLLSRLLPAARRPNLRRHVRLIAWVMLAVFCLAALLRWQQSLA